MVNKIKYLEDKIKTLEEKENKNKYEEHLLDRLKSDLIKLQETIDRIEENNNINE